MAMSFLSCRESISIGMILSRDNDALCLTARPVGTENCRNAIPAPTDGGSSRSPLDIGGSK